MLKKLELEDNKILSKRQYVRDRRVDEWMSEWVMQSRGYGIV